MDGITNAMDMNWGQTSGDGAGQGGLAGCSPWVCRVGHNWAADQQQSLNKLHVLLLNF